MRKVLFLVAGLLVAATSWAVTIRQATPEESAPPQPIQLQDASPILGSWTLVEVAPRATGPRIPENRTWEFKPDGTLITSGYNRHFKREDRQEFHYQIKDGMIVTDVPGRPDKQLVYQIYDLKDSTLVLQGGVEGFYFFKRK
ncbi:MAG: lipocalin family protein [Methylohalobius sp.]